MWASTVPAAIDAFVAALDMSPDLAGVGLRDGPRVVRDGTQDVVTVGFVDQTDPAAADGSFTAYGLATEPSQESYAVHCVAWVQRGGGDIKAARDSVYGLLSAAGGVLAADPTLGGVVVSARLGTVGLEQRQTKGQGAVARLTFDVVIDADTAV